MTAMLERIVDRATATVINAFQDTLTTMGDRPAGFEQADPLDLLDHFIETCRTPGAWEQVIAADAQVVGPAAAHVRVVKAATDLTRMLARRGGWDGQDVDPVAFQRAIDAGVESVESAQVMRRLGKAQRALAEVEKLEAKPAAVLFEVKPAREMAAMLVPREE